ncbi:MAG: Na+/H+ antiporter subunit E [Candidatus Rokubacteria bacterium]|nr:Na+/H+ antiporter subunit E [Candidatus Rokubacteria bacterium]
MPLLVFAIYFLLWLLLSGHFGPIEVGLGIVASAAVWMFTRDFEAWSSVLRVAPRFMAYLPWLLKEIVLANFQVARVVLDPRLPIDPTVVPFRVPFHDDLTIATLANSITLTPGTVTLDVEGQELTVHSLLGPEAVAVCQGPMARRVGRVFGERMP